MSEDVVLRLEDVYKYFVAGGLLGGKSVVRAVDGVSLEVRRGEVLGLVGESGSGKTTLGRTALRLYKPTRGRIIFMGHDITWLPEKKLRPLRRYMQLVPQDPYASFNPRLRIGDSIKEVLEVHGVAAGDEAKERVYKILERVGLVPASEFYERYPYQLSGGQLQRAAIARAMVVEPIFVVADEPTSSLDASIRASILDLLLEFKEALKQSMIFITHDLATARLVADRIAVMYLGKVVEEGPAHEVLRNPLHPYTKALLSAVPKLSRRRVEEEKVRLKGEVPDPRSPPPGCRLHPRCPFARERCSKEEPPMIEAAPGHRVACWLYARS